jgi:hypothetical protein
MEMDWRAKAAPLLSVPKSAFTTEVTPSSWLAEKGAMPEGGVVEGGVVEGRVVQPESGIRERLLTTLACQSRKMTTSCRQSTGAAKEG